MRVFSLAIAILISLAVSPLVLESLAAQKDLVEIVHTLRQTVCVKG